MVLERWGNRKKKKKGSELFVFDTSEGNQLYSVNNTINCKFINDFFSIVYLGVLCT